MHFRILVITSDPSFALNMFNPFEIHFGVLGVIGAKDPWLTDFLDGFRTGAVRIRTEFGFLLFYFLL